MEVFSIFGNAANGSVRFFSSFILIFGSAGLDVLLWLHMDSLSEMGQNKP